MQEQQPAPLRILQYLLYLEDPVEVQQVGRSPNTARAPPLCDVMTEAVQKRGATHDGGRPSSGGEEHESIHRS